MEKIKSFITKRLAGREKEQSLRRLSINDNLIDFSSNDYLGLARSEELQSLIIEEISAEKKPLSGSTGSRLISGNSIQTEALEKQIADFHHAEASLIFNSGYDANIGFFSSIPQRGDTIITDELIHASIIDGCRLSFANRYSFKHNDLKSLEEKLKLAKGNVFVAVESIYSMDGDKAPLREIADLADKFGAALVVDEAHSAGIFGPNGEGLVYEYNLQDRVFARLVTFGKAFGCHGAAILGDTDLRSYLINFARSFIYTTASSPFSHLAVKAAYKVLQTENLQSRVKEKIEFFRQEATDIYPLFIDSHSPIQSLVIGGNERTKAIEDKLHNAGFYVRAILHPTVPAGQERLRICLHAFNTNSEIQSLIKLLKESL